MQSPTSGLRRSLAAAAIAAVATAGMVLMVTPARADTSDSPTAVKVRFADLNLSSPQGAKVLYMRLKMAAESVCDDDDEFIDLVQRTETERCVREAIEAAVVRVDSPQLSQVYNHLYPRERVNVAMTASSSTAQAR